MSKNIYTLIAYKPNSDSYCRGCLMASYSSNFSLAYNLNRDSLIESLTLLLVYNKNLEVNEDRYNFIILDDNRKLYDTIQNCTDASDEDRDVIKEVLNQADRIASSMVLAEKIEKAQREEREKQRAAKQAEESRRILYEQLKAEFDYK